LYSNNVIAIFRYYYNLTINIVSHVTIPFVTSALLLMVHCDHASIFHRYGDMASQMLDERTHGRTHGRSGDFILYRPYLHWTDKNTLPCHIHTTSPVHLTFYRFYDAASQLQKSNLFWVISKTSLW